MITTHGPICAILIAAVATAQPSKPATHYIQLQRGEARDVVIDDLNGDGRPDLVIGIGPVDGARWLHVHFARDDDETYSGTPDRALRLVRDAVAFAVADVTTAPGRELVLLSPSRAAAVFWEEAREEPSYRPLLGLRLLWQPAHPRRCFAWRGGVVDLDGDGLDDLLLPEPSGYRIALQRRSSDSISFDTTELVLPPRPPDALTRGEARIDSSSVRFRMSVDDQPSGPLLHLVDALPSPHAADCDGDGRLDVVALAGRELLIWHQRQVGTFDGKAPARIDVGERRGSLTQRWTAKALLEDLDGDRRAELVMVSTRNRGDEVVTAIEVFRPSADELGTPIDRLQLRGWGSRPEFDDVDGDGRPDLAIGSLRADDLSGLAGGSTTVDGQLNLFRSAFESDGGRFQRPVALAHRTTLPTEKLRDRGVRARFFRDLDGDGLRDLFLATGGRLAVYPTASRGRGFAVGDEAWSMPLPDGAELWMDDTTGMVVVRELAQVQVLQWRKP